MRAAVLDRFRSPLRIDDVPEPQCPADGVVLQVLACGVCRSDHHAWSGADPDIVLPHIPGHEFCGEIVAVGPQVSTWAAGDRVVAPFILACGVCRLCRDGLGTGCPDQIVPGFTVAGAFAEQVAVPRADTNLAALPETMDPVHAAALGCRVTTAWHALTGRAALADGEWLAVFGGGGIGVSTLILGRALGARVVVVDVVAEKLRFAADLGADAVVDATAGDPAAAVREITGGGAHVAVEALGVPATLTPALRSLRTFGRMVQVGMPVGEHASMPVPMDAVYRGQLSIFGTRGMPAHRYPSLLSLIADGRVDIAPLVTRRIGLGDVTAELQAFDGPAEPGVAVVSDLTA